MRIGTDYLVFLLLYSTELLTNIDIPVISDHIGAERGRQVEAGEEEAQHQPPMLLSHWPLTPCPLIGPPRPRPHPVLYRCTEPVIVGPQPRDLK